MIATNCGGREGSHGNGHKGKSFSLECYWLSRVMPMTTNHIQDQRIHPHAWSHSPRICYRLPRSLACHHYATPTSYSTVSCPHNPTQDTTRPHPNKHSRTRVTTMLAQARVPPTRLLEFSLKFLVASLYLVPFPFMYIVVLTSALPLSRSRLVP